MPTNLRPNNLETVTDQASNFGSSEKSIASATQVTPDRTTDSVVILFAIYEMAED